MRILITSILVLLFISSLTYALEDDFTLPVEGEFEAMYITEGMLNGQRWRTLQEKEKALYLFGFEDGTINTAIHYLSDEKLSAKILGSLPASAGASMSDLIKRIDEFYSDGKNIHIPVCYVLLIIRNRLLGVDESKIQRYIEYLRSGADEDLKKVIEQKD